jgi:HicB family
MQLSLTTDALKEDLERLADFGGDEVAVVAGRIASALGATVTVRLLDLLGQAALEVSGQLQSGRVDLRVAGGEASLVVVDETDDSPSAGEGELTARITLRLPEQLKSRVETAAAGEGISTNTWIQRVIDKATSSSSRKRSGRHLSGFGQS